MPEIIIPQRFAQRRGTVAEWANGANILFQGEIGFELDATDTTVKWKIGDGVTPWATLPYFASGSSAPVSLQATSTHIQWRVLVSDPWVNLVALSALQGPQGTQGNPGAASTVPGPPGSPAIGAAIRAVLTVAGGTSTMAVGRTALLIRLSSDAACRARFYTTSTARAADIGRAAAIPAAQGAGLLLEFIATPALLGAPLTPGIIAHNGDGPTASLIYCNVEPVGATANVSITYMTLEA